MGFIILPISTKDDCVAEFRVDVKAAFQSLAESYDRLADVSDQGHTKVKPAPSRVTGDDK
jgi:hypothetical protein